MGDRPPSVEIELGVHGQMDANVVTPVPGDGATRPGTRHHEAGTRGQALAQGLVHPGVGRVAQSEVVAGQDKQLGVVRVAEALHE